MEDLTSKLIEWGASYGLKIIGALTIIIVGRIAVGVLIRIIRRVMSQSNTDETLIKFVTNLSKVALLTFIFIAALGTLGVQTASFVAVIGAAGLAVGFALQGSLANFASGVMIIIFRPFKAGDYVEAGGVSGTVEAVHIFNIILKTPDNKIIIVPSSKITGDNITNYSAEETRRVDMIFDIGYGDDIKKAKTILQQLLKDDARILKEPAPVVAVSELADSSVKIVVRPWVKTPDYWGVYFDLTEKVKLTFDEQGISIPFPQSDVHLFQATA